MFYVYIVTNKRNTVLYTGVTNNLQRRISEHKQGLISSFTKKYKVNKLIFYKTFPTAVEAIMSEKKIKGWTRKKKTDLIKSVNPDFGDLAEEA